MCALCTPTGRQCLNNNLLPIHPEWSDSEEEEEDLNKRRRRRKRRNGRLGQYPTKQKVEQELELQKINMKISKSGPETRSTLETKDTKVHTSHLTDTLIGKTKEITEKEEQKDDSHDSDNDSSVLQG